MAQRHEDDTSDGQETSHQTEIGEQMEAHSMHGDSIYKQPKSKTPPQEQPQPKSKTPPQEQPQPKSKTPPQEQPQIRMATTAGSHTGETTLVFPSGNAPPPQQPQAPSDDAPLPQQPTGTTPPSELTQFSQESGATPLHEIDDQKQVSTTLPTPDKSNNDNYPITNQSQEPQPKHDDSGNMVVPKDESGQSSTQTQSTNVPLKTAASTSKTPSQQAGSNSEVLTMQIDQVSVS